MSDRAAQVLTDGWDLAEALGRLALVLYRAIRRRDLVRVEEILRGDLLTTIERRAATTEASEKLGP